MNIEKRNIDSNLTAFSIPQGWLFISNGPHFLYSQYSHAYAAKIQEDHQRKGYYKALIKEALRHVQDELGLKGLVFLPKFPSVRNPSFMASRSETNGKILLHWSEIYDIDVIDSPDGPIYLVHDLDKKKN